MGVAFVGKEEGEALDEYDLKQLPDIDEELEKRLNGTELRNHAGGGLRGRRSARSG